MRLETITTRVPEEVYRDIKRIEAEEKAERAEVIRRLLSEAIKRWKLKKALEMLREGRATMRTAAKLADLSYIELLDVVEATSVPLDYTLTDLKLDLAAVKKER